MTELFMSLIGIETVLAQQPEVVQQSNTVLFLGLATAIGTVLTTAIAAIGAYYIAKLNTKATSTAEKAEEVRKSLQVNRTATDAQLNKIEHLVNGGVEKLLRQAAVASRRAANATGVKRDLDAAEAAEEALAEHIAAQIKVDAARSAEPKPEPKPKSTTMGLGEAVGEIGTDVKEVKQDVKDLKEGKP